MTGINEISLEEAYKFYQQIPEFKGNPPDSFKEFADRIKGTSLALVATLNNTPAGFMVSYDEYNDGSFYIWLSGVLPEFRNKGVFTIMKDYQEKWAKEKGYKSIKIKTWNKRIEMRITLAKAGYNIIGFEEKENIEENRLMHEKELQ